MFQPLIAVALPMVGFALSFAFSFVARCCLPALGGKVTRKPV